MPACPSCGSQVADSATFCPNCGASLLRPCPSCGSQVSLSARFCPTCGNALEAAAAPRQEERKLVTLLFADVTGSTSLGERLDPERVRSLLSAYFSAMSAVIESWGGIVEKFIGDAIMAAFGVPIVREDDPERALRAALDMLAHLQDLNRDFEQRHGVTLQIRIGVNTGEVIAPVSGPVEQMIVAGDAVNVAARLEQAAEPGSILVGERTYVACRNAFRFEPPVALDLKGKANPVNAWRLVEPLAEAARGVPGLQSAMVGRDRELETLLTMLEETLESRRPRMLAVYGPAGIGKSRLVWEFLHAASASHGDLVVMRGRCLAVGHGITYWALGEILRGATGIGLAEPGEVAADKLRRGVRDLLAPLALNDSDLDHTVFALAFTAGITLPDNPLDAMEPRAVADELSRAWPRFASACASRGAMVVVVEDLHWAEEQLLDMLERLLARSSGPILFVVTARPEFAEARPQFATGREEASSVSLRPLTGQQSEQLIEGLLAVADLPAGLRDEILGKAEGNPFFVEEIVRRLIDEGALVREGEGWRATAAAQGIVLPDTVHALLAARIDALPREEKRVLQEAAVVGRVFWEEPVTRAIGDGAVSDALLRLERRGLVFVRPTSTIAGQTEFMFKHALVRDVAYASLPKSRRALAHAEHGAWLEELAGDRVEEFAELIAHHYLEAAAGEDADLAWADESSKRAIENKAFVALMRAGNSAKKRSALGKAVELHEQAVTLAGSDRDRVRAQEELGDDQVSRYHGDEAVAAYQEAIDLVKGDPQVTEDLARLCSKAARMIIEKSGAFRSQPEGARADALVRMGLDAAREPETKAWLLSLFGQCALYWRTFAGQDPIPIEDRISTAEQGVALAEELGTPDLLTLASRTLSELYMSEGAYARAVEASRRQLAVVDRILSPTDRALSLFEVSSTSSDLASEFERGLELARRSHDIAKSLSAHDLMHSTYAQMLALYPLGRWDDVIPVMEEHLSVYEQEREVLCFAVRGGPFIGALVIAHRGDPERALTIATMALGDPTRARPGLQALHASVLLACGELERGRATAEAAWEMEHGGRIIRMKSPWDRPLLTVLDARLLSEDLEGLADILPVARRLEEIPFAHAACDRAEGFLRVSTGDSEGLGQLRTAADAFERRQIPFEAARTQELLARFAPEESSARLRSALRAYEALGAQAYTERVRAALARSG